MEIKIPENDLRDINAIFGNTGSADALIKKSTGRVISAKKETPNKSIINFKSFSGKILKHQKSVVILGTGQLVIGVAGQRFDDIPADDRKLVVWDESDFI